MIVHSSLQHTQKGVCTSTERAGVDLVGFTGRAVWGGNIPYLGEGSGRLA